MNYPRVLIIGQTFNDFSGGGITLSSLFYEWPKESLANISYPFMIHNSTTDICNNYYQIGNEEIRWKFPFFLIKKKFYSGRITVREQSRVPVINEDKRMRHSVSSHILMPFLRWTGLVHSVSSIRLSGRLKEYLRDFSPEIVYLQISNYESIRVSIELIDYLKTPSVIHMMDDWPSTISSRGLFKKYWHRVIDREFRVLLGKTNLHLSISNAMSEEYLARYGKHFIPFHNSIEAERFDINEKVPKDESNKFRILYVGRIGTANRSSLYSFAEFISEYNLPGFDVKFDIYTKDSKNSDARMIGKLKKVTIHSAVEHTEIPGLLVSYDILLLPLDFTESGRRFARFSMPTKAIEYMASGTPVLVYAPPETAIYKFCDTNKCAHCIGSQNNQALSRSLLKLFTDHGYRNRLAINAKQIANEQFNGVKVRQEFRNMLFNLLNHYK